jgi:chromosome partitioning protein
MTSVAANDASHRTGKRGDLTRLIESDAELLSAIQALRLALFPSSEKELRKFTSGEAAKLIESLTPMSVVVYRIDAPEAKTQAVGGCFPEQIHELRCHLTKTKQSYHRIAGTMNIEGTGRNELQRDWQNNDSGPRRTTFCDGYRTLAIDLTRRLPLSALFGLQPEFDLQDNDTLYGAIRYDEQRPLSKSSARRIFPGLDVVPGNLEQEFEHDTPRGLAERSRGTGRMFFSRIAASCPSNMTTMGTLDCPPSPGS